ncbi:MAG TPA: YqgE/AlgH family protein [Verrucomicrobiae bacterium]|nr:YqgE/AlgH family protein [Verrucomicrobiae bacterium]
MSLGNLCFFAVLASVMALPATRGSELRPSDTRTRNSSTLETPPAVVLLPSRNPSDLGLGRLLVASRELSDPIFGQTVILLVHYDTDGVIGLMLNRRTDLPISRVFAQLKTAKNLSDPVYLGGPVETPTVFALFHSPQTPEVAQRVFGGVYWISAKSALEKLVSSHPAPAVFHVYLGYAGWTPEQLRNEVRLGGWFIFPADHDTVFHADPDSLWRQMIRKTEIEMKMAGDPKRGPALKSPAAY